jgi:WD40 repeat protein
MSTWLPPNPHFEKLVARLYSHTPFIGRQLRQIAVKSLVKDGSARAMHTLADTLIRHHDSKIRQQALKALINSAARGNPAAQDALCQLMVEHRHPEASQIVLAEQYAPQEPSQRLFFVERLVKIVLHNDDSAACQNALKTLVKMAAEGKSEARESLCSLAIDYDFAPARDIVLASQYVPQNPYQRAIFYVFTAQWDKYEQLDFDRRLLKIAYRVAKKSVQKWIVTRIRQDGRGDLLAALAIEEQQPDKMTDSDWEAMLAMLSKNGEWEELWQLAQVTPLIWSMRFLLRLQKMKWLPTQETERATFLTLARLAEECRQTETETLSWLAYCHETLEGYADHVRCLAISPDGQVLASGSGDNTVRLWNLPDEMALRTLDESTPTILTSLPYCEYHRKSALRILKGHPSAVTSLAVSPDGTLLVSGGKDKTIRLWSLPGGMWLRTLSGHAKSLTCFALSADSRLLASGSEDHTIRLWSLPDGSMVNKLKVGPDAITCLAISPDKQVLAGGGTDNSIRLWDLHDGKILQTLKGHSQAITCIAISPDGRILASGSRDQTVRLWNLPAGTALNMLRGHTDTISALLISPDGQLLASGSHDHTIRLWNLPDGMALKTLQGHVQGVSCITISPNDCVLASGGFDRTVRLWVFGKVDVSRLSAEQINLNELRLFQERLQEREITDAERKWLEFLLALVSWQRRFDIEVGDASLEIPVGEFDIEIEL